MHHIAHPVYLSMYVGALMIVSLAICYVCGGKRSKPKA